jgi:capsular exopolysaccharide synthesis family protein
MKKEVIAHKNPKSPISEIFRTLRTNIQFMNVDKKIKTLLVTSTYPGEGKSWTTSNLAVTFAQAGKKVIVIDSDMRKGRAYVIFGVAPRPGLSDFLSQTEIDENGNFTEDVLDYIQETEVENLYIMSSGTVPPNPSELLVSSKMTRLLEELKSLCDIVVIDGTPCELVTDSVIVDATIIVTAHKITKKDVLQRVVKNIKNVGGNIAGVVINKMPISSKRYGEKYYYYGGDRNRKKSKSKKETSSKKSKKEINEMNSQKNKMRVSESLKRDKKSKEELIKEYENNMKNENNAVNTENNNSKTNKSAETINNENINNNSNINTNNQNQNNKTNEILNQINTYLEQEKKDLN